MKRKKIALFGGGPSCLIAACFLSKEHEVHVFEQSKAIGRKFLVAGNGGFNLTNNLNTTDLIARYASNSGVENDLREFSVESLRKWLKEIGIPTYVGSSNRVFPAEGIKPVHVLNAIKKVMHDNDVSIHLNSTFTGFSAAINPIVKVESEEREVEADHFIFGLGGGSWTKTGSNDKWFNAFNKIGIETINFQSSNCGVNCEWKPSFLEKFQGTPLKNCSFQIGSRVQKGEGLITIYGLEGNAIYPIVPEIRSELATNGESIIYIDFKPNNELDQLVNKTPNSLATKNYTYHFKIDKATRDIVKNSLSKEAYNSPKQFASRLKSTPVKITSLRPLEEAISSVGGISLNEVDEQFRLKKHLHISIVGEMLNWDAPTGGFLLQGCFSSGVSAAKFLLL